jgi:sugar phosphate isomerase/epimerase
VSATQFSLPTLNWIRYPGADDGIPTGGELQPAWPLEDVLAAAAGAGFSAVGLDDLTVGAYLRAGGTLDGLGALLASHGLECTDVGVLRIGACEVRTAAGALAALASAAGAGICIAALYTATADEAFDDLCIGATILAEAGVHAALEFAPYGGLRSLADAIAVCDAVGWDRCGLLVDTWHFFRSGEPWSLLSSLDPEQVALVHVNDAPPLEGDDIVRESRSRRVAPGAGSFRLAEFADALETLGYGGPVSVEVLSAPLRRRPPAEGALELSNSLRAAWPARAVRPVV